MSLKKNNTPVLALVTSGTAFAAVCALVLTELRRAPDPVELAALEVGAGPDACRSLLNGALTGPLPSYHAERAAAC